MPEITPNNVVILGSGTSTGVPVIGCECAVCESSHSKNIRTRCSIMLNFDTLGPVVIDTGPEFRMQILREQVKDLHHVIYTHIHADHCHGFDDLRSFYFRHRSPIHCYIADDFADEFKQRFSYAFQDTGYQGTKPPIELHRITESSFAIQDHEIEMIRVEHGNVYTAAFRFGKFAYCTDFKRFTAAQIANWRGKVETMVASGIRFEEHKTHSSIGETLELFQRLEIKHGIITHLSHQVDYEIHNAELPDGIELAYDGMKIDIH